jgi:hypothetical protein
MSEWLNGGAKLNSDNSDIPTKTALKRAIQNDAADVIIYVTDAFGPNAGKRGTADNLPVGVKFTVTGPNPYTSRKWYATVEKLQNGRITVK